MSNLNLLQDLMTFFDLWHDKAFDEAHRVIYEKLGLFPASDDKVRFII